MKIIDYLNPKNIYESIQGMIVEKIQSRKFASILAELNDEGKLAALDIKLKKDKMYVGVNLNPELLLYSDDEAQENVELKFVGEKIRKYTEFLQNEGILDSIKAEYDRVYSEEFYGYIVEISFAVTKYNGRRLIYDIIYSVVTLGALFTGITYLINRFI
jgi:hypothetical protein